LGAAGSANKATAQKEDYGALVRCSYTLISLRELFGKTGDGEEGASIDRVNVVRTLRSSTITPAERMVISRAQQVVREFSMSSLSSGTTMATYAQTTDTKSRTTSALLSLYLLSTAPTSTSEKEKWEPDLLIGTLQDYLRTSLTSSLASLARSLSTLPTLDRTLLEVSARCQNILALESLVSSIVPPSHPLLHSSAPPKNFLEPLLQSLETGSLASYFWRSLAGGLSTKVSEIVNRGGVSARTLKTNRKSVGDAVRECVIRGSQAPGTTGRDGKEKKEATWEREIAVMVGSVVGALGR
jgi:hypothetical protein